MRVYRAHKLSTSSLILLIEGYGKYRICITDIKPSLVLHQKPLPRSVGRVECLCTVGYSHHKKSRNHVIFKMRLGYFATCKHS